MTAPTNIPMIPPALDNPSPSQGLSDFASSAPTNDTKTVEELFLGIYYRGKDNEGYSGTELKADAAQVNALIAKARMDELSRVMASPEIANESAEWLDRYYNRRIEEIDQ